MMQLPNTIKAGLLLAPLLLATPAAAEDLRDLCPDRPGIGSPTCTVDRGYVQLEVGLWGQERDKQDGAVSRTTSIASTELRLGLTDRSEIQVSTTPVVIAKTRDASGASRVSGWDDLTIGWRRTFGSQDGLSFALQPFVTAPTGKAGIGAGAWQYGIAAPVQVSLNDSTSLAFTGVLTAAADADGAGHHPAYTGVLGLSRALGPVSMTAELASTVDDDPSERSTQALFGLAAAWIPAGLPNLQLDAGVNAGLNRQTPDRFAYLGLSQRF